MLLSRTSEYALQALIYLAAQPKRKSVLNRDVARYLGVPAPYLAKILKAFVKHGMLVSHKGRGGGYAIHPGALAVPIRTVVELTDGRDVFEGCLLGLKVCSEATACPVHHTWSPLKKGLLALLERHTIGSMAEAVRAGRYRVAANRPRPRQRARSPSRAVRE
ncbi:MAG TPA: Rrf2 family transcriptional regulator [Gemmatimonadales bacterium]|jgi:Rrf2 family protein